MIVKEVTFKDGEREFTIPLGIEISQNKVLDICNEIISNLWHSEVEKPTISVVEEGENVK